MTERTIVVLLAGAAALAVWLIVDTVLSLWFDAEMRRHAVGRPKNPPPQPHGRSVPPYPPPKRGWSDCILCGGPQHYGRCDNPERVS